MALHKVFAAALACLALAGCGGPDMLKHEPVGGLLDNGQSVLVDDGTCPTGQVKRVTAPKTLYAERTTACVPRPSGGWL